MLKDDLILAYKKVKECNNFTYSDMVDLTSLSRSQLSKILKGGGDGVSIEAMESGLKDLGIMTTVEFYNEEA